MCINAVVWQIIYSFYEGTPLLTFTIFTVNQCLGRTQCIYAQITVPWKSSRPNNSWLVFEKIPYSKVWSLDGIYIDLQYVYIYIYMHLRKLTWKPQNEGNSWKLQVSCDFLGVSISIYIYTYISTYDITWILPTCKLVPCEAVEVTS